MTPDDDTPAVDGRTARRDRNRRAVLDAILELIEEGTTSPSVAQIAERSGTSHRSLFRYFDDLDTLYSEAVLVANARYAPLSRIHHFGRGTFDERVDHLVEQRIRLFDAIGPLAQAARHRGRAADPMEAALRKYMEPLQDQLPAQFAPEIEALDDDRVESVIDALATLLSFDAFQFMRRRDASDDAIAATYRVGIEALLRPPPP